MLRQQNIIFSNSGIANKKRKKDGYINTKIFYVKNKNKIKQKQKVDI